MARFQDRDRPGNEVGRCPQVEADPALDDAEEVAVAAVGPVVDGSRFGAGCVTGKDGFPAEQAPP